MRAGTLFGLLLLLLMALPCFAEGKPRKAEGASAGGREVSFRKVTVRRGDTLKKISREHLGRASSFPRVLRYNEVKNPDLIHPGERLLVPVPRSHHAAPRKGRAQRRHPRGGVPLAVKQAEQVRPATPISAEVNEQESYRQARQAYEKEEYGRSLTLFDSFLRRFPASQLAADASLYRGDCLYRLSAQ